MRRIVVFTKNAENPNYLMMLEGGRRLAARHDARIDWLTTRTPDDPVEQAALLRRTIAERPDGILFCPADDAALVDPVREANAAGIPLVGFVNRMAGDFVSFVGADERGMGRASATALISAIGGRGRIVLIEGPDTAPTARERGRGFREAIAQHPAVIVLGARCGFYLESGGFDAMRAFIAAHHGIDGVICTNDTMALGAARACAEAGIALPIIGNNATIEAAEAIAAGRLFGSMVYDGFRMGGIATMALLRHLDGHVVPRWIMMPIEVVTAANVAPWLVPVAARPDPDWETVLEAVGPAP